MKRALKLATLVVLVGCGSEQAKSPLTEVPPVGGVGEPCFANFTCNAQLTCNNGYCAACISGTSGCPCRVDDTCDNVLACLMGTCAEDQLPPIVGCFSPCSQDFVDLGATRVCGPDGLTSGCMGTSECEEGVCVSSGNPSPPQCMRETDCPLHQACVQGTCRSTCEDDSHCKPGASCYSHVCRLDCNVADASCPSETYCHSNDGVRGFCLPLAPSDPAAAPPPVAGGFELDVTVLAFSPRTQQAQFIIKNTTATSRVFRVSKAFHDEHRPEGLLRVREQPMAWVTLAGPGGGFEVTQSLELTIPGRDEVTSQNTGSILPANARIVQIGSVRNADLRRWSGELQVDTPGLGAKRLALRYAESPSGTWSGTMHFFANFPDQGLDEWLAVRNASGIPAPNSAVTSNVRNALFQKFQLLRTNGLDGLKELLAVFEATRTEFWKSPLMRSACLQSRACYPYDNTFGFRTYSTDVNQQPVPTGVSEMPIVLNLKQDEVDPKRLAGRIESSSSLQYPGNPQATLSFANTPSDCTHNARNCVVDVAAFEATIEVGGRYELNTGSCGGGFEPVDTPFLLEGFTQGTYSKEGRLYRRECRQNDRPLSGETTARENTAYSATNPIPDGRVRQRKLSLLDGYMVDNEVVFLLFRETFDGFLGDDESVQAYGYMVLRPGAEEGISDEERENMFDGNAPGTASTPPTNPSELTCAQGVIAATFGGATTYDSVLTSATQTEQLVDALIEGELPNQILSPAAPPYANAAGLSGHYYCVETGLIDQGPLGTTDPVRCPPESEVIYFLLQGVTRTDIANLPCNRAVMSDGEIQRDPDTGLLEYGGTCGSTLQSWENSGAFGIVSAPRRRCSEGGEVFCDSNRTDLLANAELRPPPTGSRPVYNPLLSEIDSAFRYRTRFVNRSGTALGFAPSACRPGMNHEPYCYDPASIELIAQRVDCATDLYVNHTAALTPAARATLEDYLGRNFTCATRDGDFCRRMGFEHLYAELLVTLGDDAYTGAFASRFDLAGTNQALFEGNLFEPDGPRLTSGVGFELRTLYAATQYYQAALDRFFRLAPAIWTSLEDPSLDSLANLETAVTYFARLIRAASQKARTWAEISKRYASLNRGNLAKLVAERTYAGTYLESVVFSEILTAVQADEIITSHPQLVKQMEDAQRSFRSALLELGDVRSSIRVEGGAFGFAREYVPFPALDAGGPNAFDVVVQSAHNRIASAKDKELTALTTTRSFDVDQAAFESELVNIGNTYEDRLASLCGTFTGEDGATYPATTKFAGLNNNWAYAMDPCGSAGNGEIHQAKGSYEIRLLDLQIAIQGVQSLLTQIEIERNLVSEKCEMLTSDAEYVFEAQGEINSLHDGIASAQKAISSAQRLYETLSIAADALFCTIGVATDCATKPIAVAAMAVGYGLLSLELASHENKQTELQANIRHKEAALGKWQSLRQCDYAQAESNTVVKRLAIGLDSSHLEVLKARYAVSLSFAEVVRLHSEAARLNAAQQEAEQLAINVQATKNDPNVRIYKNDAILAADRTFEAALREAYRATLVYEYYTSQSYGRKGDLFLIRLVTAGELNLERYLAELEEAFYAFEELYGQPQLRVAIVSLRDDVMSIPRYGADGHTLSTAERVGAFRQRLTAPELLDGKGYLTLPYSLTFGRVSPLTRNHKIEHIEAEIVGSNVGDSIGRLYLRQAGTGTVHNVRGEHSYYVFPERLAVANVFFNGQKSLDPRVYSNSSLRDRPLINTRWEIVLNRKDELDNRDIVLESLSDIRLYYYYTDFTQL